MSLIKMACGWWSSLNAVMFLKLFWTIFTSKLSYKRCLVSIWWRSLMVSHAHWAWNRFLKPLSVIAVKSSRVVRFMNCVKPVTVPIFWKVWPPHLPISMKLLSWLKRHQARLKPEKPCYPRVGEVKWFWKCWVPLVHRLHVLKIWPLSSVWLMANIIYHRFRRKPFWICVCTDWRGWNRTKSCRNTVRFWIKSVTCWRSWVTRIIWWLLFVRN